MPQALFISKNLIGDGLNISSALRAWYRSYADPAWQIDLLTHRDHAAVIYEHMGVLLRVIFDAPRLSDYFFQFDFDCSKAFALGEKSNKHIAECYAEMLGVGIASTKPTFIPVEEEHEKDLILISPFSRSCSSQEGKPPNKMLPWAKLGPIVAYLRTLGKIGVLGGPDDRAPLEIEETEYYTGLPLNKVALMLRDCKMLFTVDNGMSHLAASQETRSIVLYPSCLKQSWITPKGNPNAAILHIDPVVVLSASLMWNVKQIVKGWNF